MNDIEKAMEFILQIADNYNEEYCNTIIEVLEKELSN